MEEEVKRLRTELFELKIKYNELLKKYTKVSNELIILKEEKYDKLRKRKK